VFASEKVELREYVSKTGASRFGQLYGKRRVVVL